eukprot:MONOS_1056.1-p1 / transcript=MONOS_1056.1 / gene=MONOS_1056 / organism=Monocercomonoides_exilis_PA203 / gene_product=unspecified product / transcript_product=unspecified product / location=Mono_scaffold00018:19315-22588(-) / protein_length=1024 / sequence_SO=supercontig / SO=protein_coding / is_pseudo=false
MDVVPHVAPRYNAGGEEIQFTPAIFGSALRELEEIEKTSIPKEWEHTPSYVSIRREDSFMKMPTRTQFNSYYFPKPETKSTETIKAAGMIAVPDRTVSRFFTAPKTTIKQEHAPSERRFAKRGSFLEKNARRVAYEKKLQELDEYRLRGIDERSKMSDNCNTSKSMMEKERNETSKCESEEKSKLESSIPRTSNIKSRRELLENRKKSQLESLRRLEGLMENVQKMKEQRELKQALEEEEAMNTCGSDTRTAMLARRKERHHQALLRFEESLHNDSLNEPYEWAVQKGAKQKMGEVSNESQYTNENGANYEEMDGRNEQGMEAKETYSSNILNKDGEGQSMTNDETTLLTPKCEETHDYLFNRNSENEHSFATSQSPAFASSSSAQRQLGYISQTPYSFQDEKEMYSTSSSTVGKGVARNPQTNSRSRIRPSTTPALSRSSSSTVSSTSLTSSHAQPSFGASTTRSFYPSHSLHQQSVPHVVRSVASGGAFKNRSSFGLSQAEWDRNAAETTELKATLTGESGNSGTLFTQSGTTRSFGSSSSAGSSFGKMRWTEERTFFNKEKRLFDDLIDRQKEMPYLISVDDPQMYSSFTKDHIFRMKALPYWKNGKLVRPAQKVKKDPPPTTSAYTFAKSSLIRKAQSRKHSDSEAYTRYGPSLSLCFGRKTPVPGEDEEHDPSWGMRSAWAKQRGGVKVEPDFFELAEAEGADYNKREAARSRYEEADDPERGIIRIERGDRRRTAQPKEERRLDSEKADANDGTSANEDAAKQQAGQQRSYSQFAPPSSSSNNRSVSNDMNRQSSSRFASPLSPSISFPSSRARSATSSFSNNSTTPSAADSNDLNPLPSSPFASANKMQSLPSTSPTSSLNSFSSLRSSSAASQCPAQVQPQMPSQKIKSIQHISSPTGELFSDGSSSSSSSSSSLLGSGRETVATHNPFTPDYPLPRRGRPESGGRAMRIDRETGSALIEEEERGFPTRREQTQERCSTFKDEPKRAYVSNIISGRDEEKFRCYGSDEDQKVGKM